MFSSNANALCDKNKIQIDISVLNPPVIYDTSHGNQDFSRLTNHPVPQNTLGLTEAEVTVQMSGQTYVKPEHTRFCIGIKAIHFTLGYESIKVYIDKKYPQTSCNYKVIKNHEDYHVNVYRQALAFFRPDIERALKEAVKNLRPEYAYTSARGTQIMKKQFMEINKKIQPLLEHINRKIAEKNYAIDTPESYRKTTAKCPKW